MLKVNSRQIFLGKNLGQYCIHGRELGSFVSLNLDWVGLARIRWMDMIKNSQ
jgi:hypothetical protein